MWCQSHLRTCPQRANPQPRTFRQLVVSLNTGTCIQTRKYQNFYSYYKAFNNVLSETHIWVCAQAEFMQHAGYKLQALIITEPYKHPASRDGSIGLCKHLLREARRDGPWLWVHRAGGAPQFSHFFYLLLIPFGVCSKEL